MNAFNNVNLAGACLIMSTVTAKKFEISEDHWIYPLGGAGTRDAYNCELFGGILTLRTIFLIFHSSLGAPKFLL
jgi:hypothetical protein